MISSTLSKLMISIAIAAIPIFLQGCATQFSPEKTLELSNVGVNKRMFLALGSTPVTLSACKTRSLAPHEKISLNEAALIDFLTNLCPIQGSMVRINGFYKTDFYGGDLIAMGYAPKGLEIEKGDIVEVEFNIASSGYQSSFARVKRIVRKSALNTKDSSCYWSGAKSGALSFVSSAGGVICPAEGWDWRNQKWADKKY